MVARNSEKQAVNDLFQKISSRPTKIVHDWCRYSEYYSMKMSWHSTTNREISFFFFEMKIRKVVLIDWWVTNEYEQILLLEGYGIMLLPHFDEVWWKKIVGLSKEEH